ncbi:MAG: flagellar filament capping protein FliD [Aliarcobacter sp.]|nr:flagellar filament capping protein FliD [Aliarcobacter sp.]
MADGILGLGSSGSVDLSSELITKLKTAESTSILDPIKTEQEDTQTEIDALSKIQTMVLELLDLVDDFDLFTSDTNIFDEVSATTTGSSVSFDATDTSNMEEGTVSIEVTQLAQKDVYQSNTISDITATMDLGTISITIDDTTYDFSTDGKTYEELVSEMNKNSGLEVSLEQVGDTNYRMVIKSLESGSDNGLTITQTDIDLGLEDTDNHVLIAQNLLATIDGIDYEKSSNKVTLESGLIIKAVSKGTSTITIEKDNTSVVEGIVSIADKYNNLVDLVNSYILGDEDENAVISDSGTLKTMMSEIKGVLFDSYGLENEENLFKYGIFFDSDGYMQVDETELTEALTDNYDDIKELFTGYAEKEGIGTRLKTYLDSLDGIDGLLTAYDDKLNGRLETLKDEYQTASNKLDEKYEQMSTQFAAYTVLITQMENSFASLKSIINDTSSS